MRGGALGWSTRGVMVLGAVFAVVLGVAWVWTSHRAGLANLKACGTVQPGGGRSMLLDTFGPPVRREINPAGTRLVLTFTSPLFAPRPVRAVVNVRDDVVMEIDCGDGRILTYDKY